MTMTGRAFFLVAALAAPIGIFLGGGIHSGQYELVPVHAHLLLFSWVSMAIFGAFYSSAPSVAESRLAWLHFMTATIAAIGLPAGFIPFDGAPLPNLIWIGATFAILSSILFICNVVRSISRDMVTRPSQA